MVVMYAFVAFAMIVVCNYKPLFWHVWALVLGMILCMFISFMEKGKVVFACLVYLFITGAASICFTFYEVETYSKQSLYQRVLESLSIVWEVTPWIVATCLSIALVGGILSLLYHLLGKVNDKEKPKRPEPKLFK